MKFLARLTIVLAAGAVPAAPLRADVADVAELFPADTLAFAEVVRPGEFAVAAASLLNGSPVAEPLRLVHDRIERAKLPRGVLSRQRAGWLALLAAPELAAEVKRVRGAAGGLVGFGPRHEPRFAAAVLLGDGYAAGFAVRAFLNSAPDVRRAGAIDGVPVFQRRTGGATEWTYAYTPGLFAAGSDRAAVADVLRRFAGAGGADSLAATESFQTCRAARRQPGVLVYALPPALFAGFEAANRAGGSRAGEELLALVRFVVDPKSVRLVRANLGIESDVVTVSAEARLDPDRGGPLAGLLSGPRISRDDFRLVPGRTGWTVTVSLPERERRAKALLALVDSIARASGTPGRLPSQAVAVADRGPGPKIADELLSSVVQVTVFRPEGSADGRAWPVIALRTQAEADARRWEQAVAKLVALATGAAEHVTAEAADGVRVVSATSKDLTGEFRWYAARSGPIIAFGPERSLVTESVARKGSVPPWPVRASDRPPVVMGLVRPAALLLPAAGAPRPELRLGLPPLWPGGEAARPLESVAVSLARVLDPLPPVYVSVSRDQDRLLIELRLPAAGQSMASAAARLLTWLGSPRGPESWPGRE